MLWVDRLTDYSKLRRLSAYRPAFGWYRGQCLDRFFIKNFLEKHSFPIRGYVLEVADPVDPRRFGGDKVNRSELFDVDPSNEKATLIADSTDASLTASNIFDFIIRTQTLQCSCDAPQNLEAGRRPASEPPRINAALSAFNDGGRKRLLAVH
jgi:hypothetical protein